MDQRNNEFYGIYAQQYKGVTAAKIRVTKFSPRFRTQIVWTDGLRIDIKNPSILSIRVLNQAGNSTVAKNK